MPRPREGEGPDDRCTLEEPQPKGAYGHSYAYSERGNRCHFCGALSPYQEAITRQLTPKV